LNASLDSFGGVGHATPGARQRVADRISTSGQRAGQLREGIAEPVFRLVEKGLIQRRHFGVGLHGGIGLALGVLFHSR
jgi:hypothetical protein